MAETMDPGARKRGPRIMAVECMEGIMPLVQMSGVRICQKEVNMNACIDLGLDVMSYLRPSPNYTHRCGMAEGWNWGIPP